MSVKKKADFTDLNVIREFCKVLVKDHNLKTQDDLHGENGIIREIQKSLQEAMLEGELNSHLGYDASSTLINKQINLFN